MNYRFGKERLSSNMRVDYILYVIAIVCFAAAASITALYTVETLWIVTLAVLGFIFLGLGYIQKPAETIVQKTVAPTSPQPAPTATQTPKVLEAPKKAAVTEEMVSELTQVKGIGAKRAEQLERLGIKTIKDLAEASAEELAAKLEISPKITGKWITNAKELAEKS
ncbi:hypothetical protein DRO34_03730 [Candidatus Bathyarchaeota archaeon]|nr:MAG: hypothetical protein DRO34_03730 [Candidatus Bathyarchaeota archaeon]